MIEFRYGKIMKIILFLCCLALAGLFIWALFQYTPEKPTVYFALILPGSLAMIGLSVYGIIDLAIGRFIFKDGGVILRSPLGYRALMHDEIRGFRVDDNYIRIIPLDKKKKQLKVTRYFQYSDRIIELLSNRYPDLNLLEGAEDEHEVLKNEALGITMEQRFEKLQEARRVARVLNGVAWVLLICMFVPEPYRAYAVGISCFYPLIVIFAGLRYQGIMTADDYEGSQLPSLGIALLMPGIGLAIRAIMDFNILTYPPAFWVAAAFVSIAVTIMYMLPSFKSVTKPLRFYGTGALMIFLNFFYSYGVVVEANGLLDQSPGKNFTTTVVKKHTANGKVRTYHVELNPWDTHTEIEDAKVTHAQYESLQAGDTVTVIEHQGYLKMIWIEVEP